MKFTDVYKIDQANVGNYEHTFEVTVAAGGEYPVDMALELAFYYQQNKNIQKSINYLTYAATHFSKIYSDITLEAHIEDENLNNFFSDFFSGMYEFQKDRLKKLIMGKTTNCELNDGYEKSNITFVAQILLNTNSTLTSLKFENNHIKHGDIKLLTDALKANSTLSSFYFTDNYYGLDHYSYNKQHMSNSDIYHFAEVLESNKTLKILALRNNSIDDFSAKGIIKSLKNNNTLTCLNLEHNAIGNDSAIELGKILQGNRTILEILELGWNQIGDDGVQALAKALNVNKTLKTLALQGQKKKTDKSKKSLTEQEEDKYKSYGNKKQNDIGQRGVNALAASLNTNTTLEHLILSSNDLGDSGADPLIQALATNDSLKTLDLSENNIGTTGAKKIAEILKINHGLKILKLEKNDIREEGAIAIAQSLTMTNTLEVLSLNNNPIYNGIIALASALKQNKSLRNFDLSGCSMNDESLNAIADALMFNKTLLRLSIQPAWGNTDAVIVFANAIKMNTTLTEIAVGLCHSCAKVYDILIDALQHNTTLIEFSLTHAPGEKIKVIEDLMNRNKKFAQQTEMIKSTLCQYHAKDLSIEALEKVLSSVKESGYPEESTLFKQLKKTIEFQKADTNQPVLNYNQSKQNQVNIEMTAPSSTTSNSAATTNNKNTGCILS